MILPHSQHFLIDYILTIPIIRFVCSDTPREVEASRHCEERNYRGQFRDGRSAELHRLVHGGPRARSWLLGRHKRMGGKLQQGTIQ